MDWDEKLPTIKTNVGKTQYKFPWKIMDWDEKLPTIKTNVEKTQYESQWKI